MVVFESKINPVFNIGHHETVSIKDAVSKSLITDSVLVSVAMLPESEPLTDEKLNKVKPPFLKTSLSSDGEQQEVGLLLAPLVIIKALLHIKQGVSFNAQPEVRKIHDTALTSLFSHESIHMCSVAKNKDTGNQIGLPSSKVLRTLSNMLNFTSTRIDSSMSAGQCELHQYHVEHHSRDMCTSSRNSGEKSREILISSLQNKELIDVMRATGAEQLVLESECLSEPIGLSWSREVDATDGFLGKVGMPGLQKIDLTPTFYGDETGILDDFFENVMSKYIPLPPENSEHISRGLHYRFSSWSDTPSVRIQLAKMQKIFATVSDENVQFILNENYHLLETERTMIFEPRKKYRERRFDYGYSDQEEKP
ncbi:hypothetical protein QVN42_16150 [Yersinia nurmii]|uniref:Surface presentation of antigen domain-containing protein n=1 Tax=Yersinia nurmii TaxID=685706 RepID=A0AAW7K7P6_9GAMM|nr:hypothetical protein [Yersinia nurmii]MDN0088887.1 hypothetical protein [Yersinia nurmii]